MRDELIDDINKSLGVDRDPTRDKQLPAPTLYLVRDRIGLDKSLETRREILTALKTEDIIDTNQRFEGTKYRLGVDELQQLHHYLEEEMPRGAERARNKFKKVAEQK